MTEGASLFAAAFRQSGNPMVLIDSDRQMVDVNSAWLKFLGYRRGGVIGHHLYEFVVGGPRYTVAEWRARLATHRYTDKANLRAADGASVPVQFAATNETVTGDRLALLVALSTDRWGSRFRRAVDEPSGTLSPRELEVVRLVARGYTAREIADELDIAYDTARTHVSNAMGKVGARSRAQLVAKALGEGLVL